MSYMTSRSFESLCQVIGCYKVNNKQHLCAVFFHEEPMSWCEVACIVTLHAELHPAL